MSSIVCELLRFGYEDEFHKFQARDVCRLFVDVLHFFVVRCIIEIPT